MTNSMQERFPNLLNMYLTVKDQPVHRAVLDAVTRPLLVDNFLAGPDLIFRPVAFMHWVLVEEAAR